MKSKYNCLPIENLSNNNTIQYFEAYFYLILRTIITHIFQICIYQTNAVHLHYIVNVFAKSSK